MEKKPENAATITLSTSSSSSGSTTIARTKSGELPPGSSSSKHPKPGHRRSGSGALFYNPSMNSATSPSTTNLLPVGNICPSGKIGRSRSSSSPRSDVLGSGSGNYGHGSIVKGGIHAAGNHQASADKGNGLAGLDAEEVKRVGNDSYRRGMLAEALRCYNRAIEMRPENAVYRTNRAAALAGLGRLGEAVRECEAALRLDPGLGRAHQRLASIYVRLGLVENAVRHVFMVAQQPDTTELLKIQAVEKHLGKCADARKIRDWKSALREADAAIAAGADSSPLLIASRAEFLLHLHHLDESDSAISNAVMLGITSPSCALSKLFGMLSDSYVHIVRAQVDMALGRFDNAVAAAEKARQTDHSNIEIAKILSNVRLVARARAQGNELFNAGKFGEACIAYGEGLMYDPSNSVLYCNRAACRSKLGQWERSIDDCNDALRIRPNYTKALLRRAESYGKLERWAESVRDYELLKNELPGDSKVSEALLHAQMSLNKSGGLDVSNRKKIGGQVEVVNRLDQFNAAITLPGITVVHFMVASNQHCLQINPFFDVLCNRYPSVNFLKVDVNESPAVSKAENVKAVPTFKIYKNGMRMKEMICPTHQVLEFSVRHYGS